jgi:hypothetical protein
MQNRLSTPNTIDLMIGHRLSVALELSHVPHVDLADHIGVGLQELHEFCKGTRRIGAVRLWAISVALHRPVGWFFNLDKPLPMKCNTTSSYH